MYGTSINAIVFALLAFYSLSFGQVNTTTNTLFIPDSNERPKIGLVLSGGGALGFAHIGTLKMIDSLDIPIDYIAGTSMGGLVSALYAIGYDGVEIEQLAKDINWFEMFTDSPERNLRPYFEKKDDGKYQLEFGLEGDRHHGNPDKYSVKNPQLEYSEGTISPALQVHFTEILNSLTVIRPQNPMIWNQLSIIGQILYSECKKPSVSSEISLSDNHRL